MIFSVKLYLSFIRTSGSGDDGQWPLKFLQDFTAFLLDNGDLHSPNLGSCEYMVVFLY